AGWGSSVLVHETVLGAQRAEIEFSDACQDVLDEHLLVQAVLEVMPVAGQPNRDIHCVPLERCLLRGISLIPHGDGPAMRTGAVLCCVKSVICSRESPSSSGRRRGPGLRSKPARYCSTLRRRGSSGSSGVDARRISIDSALRRRCSSISWGVGRWIVAVAGARVGDSRTSVESAGPCCRVACVVEACGCTGAMLRMARCRAALMKNSSAVARMNLIRMAASPDHE